MGPPRTLRSKLDFSAAVSTPCLRTPCVLAHCSPAVAPIVAAATSQRPLHVPTPPRSLSPRHDVSLRCNRVLNAQAQLLGSALLVFRLAEATASHAATRRHVTRFFAPLRTSPRSVQHVTTFRCSAIVICTNSLNFPFPHSSTFSLAPGRTLAPFATSLALYRSSHVPYAPPFTLDPSQPLPIPQSCLLTPCPISPN